MPRFFIYENNSKDSTKEILKPYPKYDNIFIKMNKQSRLNK